MLPNSFVKQDKSQVKSITFPQLSSCRQIVKQHMPHNIQTKFKKLMYFNDKKAKQHIYKRCLSSHSSLEGRLNKKCFQIFLSLPYQATKFSKYHYCKKKWRKLIVSFVEYKIRSSSPSKMSLSLSNNHAYPNSPTNRKTWKTTSVETHRMSFGEHIEHLVQQQKLKENAVKSSTYLKELKVNDFRINRLVTRKTISLHSLQSTVDYKYINSPSITRIEISERQSLVSIHSKKSSFKFRKIH